MIGSVSFLLANAAGAQEATVTGKVTDDLGRPLAGATVAFLGTALSTGTNNQGQYSLRVEADRVRGQELTLQARAIGRRPVSLTFALTPGQHVRDFQLSADPFKLDEIIVSGVLNETEQRKLTLSVSTVSQAQLQEVPSNDAFTALIGKAPGVIVSSAAGGAPGAPSFIRLRSATSFTPGAQTQQPLIIVDGLLTREGIADLNVLDIERIEVVKGPAGASLYGSDAAAGVVQIFTRRGRNTPEGKTLVKMRAELGTTSPIRFLPRNQSHLCANYDPAGDFERSSDGTVICDEKPDRYMDLPYPAQAPWRNQQENFMGSQSIITTYLSVARRQGGTNLYGSWERTGNDGLIDVPGLDVGGLVRNNLRLNLDQVVTEKLDLSLGGFYAANNNRVPDMFNVWGDLQASPPDVDLLAPNPNGQPYRIDAARFAATPGGRNPLYAQSVRDVNSDRSRFQTNARLRWRPLPWLSADAAYAYDRLSEQYRDITARGTLNFDGSTSPGEIAVVNMDYRSYNAAGTVRATHRVGELAGTLSLAALVEDTERGTVTSTGSGFTSSGAPSLENTDPASQRTYERAETIRARDYTAGLQLDYRGRYLLDVLIRTDGTSLFGPDARWQTFYRTSAAWRVSRDVAISGVDELRIRGSVGTAGLRPPYEAQYETFTVNSGLIYPDVLGNKDLRPAHSTEWEVGFNLDFLSRFSLEYSYARKVTRDQVLRVPVTSASGFQAQWQNAGTLEGYSHEASLQAAVVATRDWGWLLRATFDRSTSTITELAVPPFSGGGGMRYEVGVPYGAVDYQRFVRSCPELKQNPANASADCANYEVNSDGYLILKGTQGTTEEAPIRFVDETGRQYFTFDPTPSFILGFQTTLTWKGLTLYGLLDWRQGGRILDYARFSDAINGTYTGAFFDQRGKPQSLKKTPNYYEAITADASPNDWLLRDGSYARLRELSLGLNLSDRDLARLGLGRWLGAARLALIGRNLFTFTKYDGWDPEANVDGAAAAYGTAPARGFSPAGDPTTSRFASATYPSFRTVSVMIEVSF